MPYGIRKSPNKNLYWVYNKETGKKFSKKPIPRERAEAQRRAIYASENGYKLNRSRSRSLRRSIRNKKRNESSPRSNKRVYLNGGECTNDRDPISLEDLKDIPLKYRIEIPTGQTNEKGFPLEFCYDIRQLAPAFSATRKNPLSNAPFTEDNVILLVRKVSNLRYTTEEDKVLANKFLEDLIGKLPVDNVGNTPVVHALINRYFKIAGILLKDPKYGSVNDVMNNRKTLLVWSLSLENEDVFNFLIQHGVDVNKKSIVRVSSNAYVTPLMVSMQFKKLYYVTVLQMRGADVNAQDINGLTALHYAVIQDYDTRPLMQYLIDHGARLDLGGRLFESEDNYYTPDTFGIVYLDYERSIYRLFIGDVKFNVIRRNVEFLSAAQGYPFTPFDPREIIHIYS
jgi:ankyrin repeat protein